MIDENKYITEFYVSPPVKENYDSRESLSENGIIVDGRSVFDGTLAECREEAIRRISICGLEGRYWMHINEPPIGMPIDYPFPLPQCNGQPRR